jgi:hypothetical protein
VKDKIFVDPDEAKYVYGSEEEKSHFLFLLLLLLLFREACFALEALSEAQAIDTLLNSFIIPLQTQVSAPLDILFLCLILSLSLFDIGRLK